MDNEPEVTPAEASILLNIEVRRRVVEALYETLTGSPSMQGSGVPLQEADDHILKSGLRSAMSTLILDVLESKEYSYAKQRKEMQGLNQQMQASAMQQMQLTNQIQQMQRRYSEASQSQQWRIGPTAAELGSFLRGDDRSGPTPPQLTGNVVMDEAETGADKSVKWYKWRPKL